jgi:hypothetical protein
VSWADKIRSPIVRRRTVTEELAELNPPAYEQLVTSPSFAYARHRDRRSSDEAAKKPGQAGSCPPARVQVNDLRSDK